MLAVDGSAEDVRLNGFGVAQGIELEGGAVADCTGGAPGVGDGGIASQIGADAGDGDGRSLDGEREGGIWQSAAGRHGVSREGAWRQRVEGPTGVGVVDVEGVSVAGDEAGIAGRRSIQLRVVDDVEGDRVGGPGSRCAHASEGGEAAGGGVVEIEEVARLVIDEQQGIVG